MCYTYIWIFYSVCCIVYDCRRPSFLAYCLWLDASTLNSLLFDLLAQIKCNINFVFFFTLSIYSSLPISLSHSLVFPHPLRFYLADYFIPFVHFFLIIIIVVIVLSIGSTRIQTIVVLVAFLIPENKIMCVCVLWLMALRF